VKTNVQQLVGTVINGLEILGWESRGEKYKRKIFLYCRCRCAELFWANKSHVLNGHTTSCGCEGLKNRIASRTKHGATGSREFRQWVHAKQRCYNPKDKEYKRYGARGIWMCKEWKESFSKFLEDIGPCPIGLTLERKNNNGPYSKDNCKWDTPKNQARNRRTSFLITYKKKTKTLAEWSEISGIKAGTLRRRILAWKDLDRVFNDKVWIGRNQYAK
jgi:hypothetical protein